MKATLQQIEWTWHLQAGSKRRWGKLEWGVGGGGGYAAYYTARDSKGTTCVHRVGGRTTHVL